jgi:hypothetical protein
MPDKMRHFYRGWYVWLMRIAHFRSARVAVAVMLAILIIPAVVLKALFSDMRSALKNAVRDAREGDWS